MLKNIQIICNDNECEIYNIGVKEPWRKIGIGNLLLKKVVEKSKKLNIKSIWLEVRESNKTAINFYQKHKFKEVHRRKNFYNNPVEQAIIMRLDIL
jgi:ribosomal-protein-alanine N-acetyltransferase